MSTINVNRRTLMKLTAGTLAAAPLFASHSVLAKEGEKLAADDPMAVALGYKDNSAEVDAEKHPTHKPEQVCTGCALYQGDDPDWGPCGAFANKLVAGKGWCQAYVAKPA